MSLKYYSLAFAAVLVTGCQLETAEPGADDNEESAQQADHGSDDFWVPGGHGPLVQQGPAFVNEIYAFEGKQWLKWAMGQPWSTGPVTDTTGAACNQNQSGPVFFLAGTPGGDLTRSCTIPKHKFLYFPLINNWVIATADQVGTPAELADYNAFVAQYFPDLRAHTCELHLAVDGTPVLPTKADLDAKLWTQVLEPFGVNVNADNFASQFGFPGGFAPAATFGGHYALLRPLSKGNHEIDLGGSLCDDDNQVIFETAVAYHLDVTD